MIDRFLGDAFGILSCQFWSAVLQSGARLPIHTLNYWTVQLVVPGFELGVCLSVALLIGDSWQSFVCFTRSGVKRCTLLMVLYLDRMCQCGLHAVLWLHIGTLMHRLAAEPSSTAGLLFPSRCPCGMILLTPYSMVPWDWRVSRAGPMFFNWPNMLYPFYNLLLFFPSLLSAYRLVLWGWGLRTDRVYITLSLSLALPTFFNNNNINLL